MKRCSKFAVYILIFLRLSIFRPYLRNRFGATSIVATQILNKKGCDVIESTSNPQYCWSCFISEYVFRCLAHVEKGKFMKFHYFELVLKSVLPFFMKQQQQQFDFAPEIDLYAECGESTECECLLFIVDKQYSPKRSLVPI